MDTSRFGSWPKDFATGLPSVPTGEILTLERYKKSRLGSEMPSLPVLQGMFDASLVDFAPGHGAHVGWGHVRLEETDALTFRLQLGPNVLYWLANAADPEVHQLHERWRLAGKMALAAEFADGRALVIGRDYEASAPLQRVMERCQQTALAFAADVVRLTALGDVKDIATTDLPEHPLLRHVQVCMLCTNNTRPFAINLNDDEVGAEGPVAMAFADLATRMQGIGEKRH